MTIRKHLALFVLFGMPGFAGAETWTSVPLIDGACAAKAKANPDAHTRNCALQCSKAGYGILSTDGTFLRFDSSGNDQALGALQASNGSDHLRVTVTGERAGEEIKVKTLKLQ
ncbi:MAG TPA: hypothetical protein VH351_00645 [Bryobacteraceae bacterium]|jgi:hypothetical protein|nr:hypothetical protein [Bryobacteraceae bacterium]